MPTYQYECESCSHVFDAMQSMMDKKLKKCPKCSKMTLVRHIGGGSGIIFKGSGFYETDYKSKGLSDASSKSSTAKSGGPSSGAGHCHSGGCGCASPSVSAPVPAVKKA